MRDGSTEEGYARFNLTNDLVFKTHEGAEKENYDEKTVSRIKMFSEEGEETIYDYKLLEGRSKSTVVMLELVEAGNVNLYLSKHTSSMPLSGMGMGMGAGIPLQQTVFYLSRAGEEIAIKVKNPGTRSRKFRKVAKEIFRDCPSLLTKLNNREFRKGGIEEVVDFYNTECGKVKI